MDVWIGCYEVDADVEGVEYGVEDMRGLFGDHCQDEIKSVVNFRRYSGNPDSQLTVFLTIGVCAGKHGIMSQLESKARK